MRIFFIEIRICFFYFPCYNLFHLIAHLKRLKYYKNITLLIFIANQITCFIITDQRERERLKTNARTKWIYK